MSELTPNYTDIDFQTMTTRLRTLLERTETFKDYDFEGSNISVLMELVSYVGDLNTFFTNKLAQNIHPESANVYEVVHSIVRSQGHIPKGYIAAEINVTVQVADTNFVVGNDLTIPAWFSVDTNLSTDAGEPIYYTTTEQYTYKVLQADIDNGYVDIPIVMKQGKPASVYYEFTNDDIVDNTLLLPVRQWDHGQTPYTEHDRSIDVLIGAEGNEQPWTRVESFVDDVGVVNTDDNVYVLEFDKYRRYNVVFSSTRNVPSVNDNILVMVVETEGAEGNVGANIFTDENKPETDTINGVPDQAFITNASNNVIIPAEDYTLTNTISTGGANYQDIDELKLSGESSIYSQNRNVTFFDYIGDLQDLSDVAVANVWGEQEENPDTLIPEYYNNVYMSTIYSGWDDGDDSKMALAQYEIQSEFTNDTSSIGEFPDSYDPTFQTSILNYIEPKKMISIRENFVLPEFVLFRFDIGLKIKRSYNFNVVRNDVLNKLSYYFETQRRLFNETIDFREIYNFLVDTTETSDTDDFDAIAGINSLVIRDVVIYRLTFNTAVDGTELGGGTGTGLEVKYRIRDGAVVDVYIEDGGTGYSTSDLITLNDPAANGEGDVTNTGSIVAGTGYSDAFGVAVTGGTGTGCLVDIVTSGGGVTGVTVVNGGGGYTASDVLTIQAGNGDATFTATSVGSSGGTDAQFTVVTQTAGVVESLSIDTAGSQYIYKVPTNSSLGTGEYDEMGIHNENVYNNFPYYVETGYTSSFTAPINNELLPIKIGYNQFPRLNVEFTSIINES